MKIGKTEDSQHGADVGTTDYLATFLLAIVPFVGSLIWLALN